MWPLSIAHFLGDSEVAKIRNYINSHQHQFAPLQPDDYWAGRCLDWHRIEDPEILDIMIRNRKRIGQELSDRIGQPLYGELLQIVRWPPGYELIPHADSEEPDGRPHPFPWRDFASITYLNDDYEGGEIHFPNKDICIQPEPGMMATFPGTLEFLHGVYPVTTGVRYTLASFFTFNPQFKDQVP